MDFSNFLLLLAIIDLPFFFNHIFPFSNHFINFMLSIKSNICVFGMNVFI